MWDRTEPREVLIAQLRARQASTTPRSGTVDPNHAVQGLPSPQSTISTNLGATGQTEDTAPPSTFASSISSSASLGSATSSSQSDETPRPPPQPRVSLAVETAPLRISKPRPKVIAPGGGLKSKLTSDLAGSRTALSVLGEENVLRKVRR